MALITARARRGRASRRIRLAVVEMVVALALVTGAAFGLSACTISTGSQTTSTASPITTVTQSTGGGTGTTSATIGVAATDGLASPAESVATKLGPSVVNIKNPAAEGSGVIYSADGMIITNNHMVVDPNNGDPVSTLEVTLATGEKMAATIVGRDPLTDLAVIKVSGSKQLPAATFVTEYPKVGEYAVAIGSPLGFENSVTLGIVSALNRSIDIPDYGTGQVMTFTGLMQIDTPISGGNSGGALANASGQVIGINQAKVSSPQAENIGFAIPSVVVTKVAAAVRAFAVVGDLGGGGEPRRSR